MSYCTLFSSSNTHLSSSFKSSMQPSQKCSLKLFSNLIMKTGFSVLRFILQDSPKLNGLSGVDSNVYKWKQTYTIVSVITPILLVPVNHSIQILSKLRSLFRSSWDYGLRMESWSVLRSAWRVQTELNNACVSRKSLFKRVQVWFL